MAVYVLTVDSMSFTSWDLFSAVFRAVARLVSRLHHIWIDQGHISYHWRNEENLLHGSAVGLIK